jgi:hypothetical protein
MYNIPLLAIQIHHLASMFDVSPAPPAGATVPTPMVDTTGTNQALINIAQWGAGLTVGFIMLAFVWHGLQYMWTHDLNRSTQLKIAAAGILGGAMVVLLAINLAPEFVKLILNN